MRVEAAVSDTTRVKALGPPQMEELSPEQGMVQAEEVWVREAPLLKMEPQ